MEDLPGLRHEQEPIRRMLGSRIECLNLFLVPWEESIYNQDSDHHPSGILQSFSEASSVVRYSWGHSSAQCRSNKAVGKLARPPGGAGLSEIEWQGTVGTRQPTSLSLPPATPDCAHPHALHCHTPTRVSYIRVSETEPSWSRQELCCPHLGLGGAVHTCLPSPAGKSPVRSLVDTSLPPPPASLG